MVCALNESGCGEGLALAKEDHFREWMQQVDLELTMRCGLNHDDLSDQPWRDWYDDGMSATEAVNDFFINEGLPF